MITRDNLRIHGGHPLTDSSDRGSSHKTSGCSNSINSSLECAELARALDLSLPIYLKLSKPDDDDDDDGLSIVKQTLGVGTCDKERPP